MVGGGLPFDLLLILFFIAPSRCIQMSAAVLAILRWQTLDVDPPISPRRSRIKRVWLVCKWWMKKQRKSENHCVKHQFQPPPSAHPPKKKNVLALMIPVMRLCWFMGRGKKQSLSRFNGQIHLAPMFTLRYERPLSSKRMKHYEKPSENWTSHGVCWTISCTRMKPTGSRRGKSHV